MSRQKFKAGTWRQEFIERLQRTLPPGMCFRTAQYAFYGTQDFLSAVAEPFHINRLTRKCPTDVPTRQPGRGMRSVGASLLR